MLCVHQALQEGGNEDYTIKELPDLNHMFQTAQTGLMAEYPDIEETISPIALSAISDWILTR